MDSLKGRFLVASPHLPDSNFFRSVVLIVAHDSEGAWGLILNRPTRNKVEEIWEAVSEEPCGGGCIYMGGPGAGPLLALHTDPVNSECEVMPGLFICSHRDHLRDVLGKPDESCRVYTGYSGWAPSQLESEMESGGWMTAEASLDKVFLESDDLWRQVAQAIGADILSEIVGPESLPDDPRVN